jgi:hypothetical protein
MNESAFKARNGFLELIGIDSRDFSS